MNPCLALDGGLGFAAGARRVLQEGVFQGRLMGGQFVGLAFPGRATKARQAAVGELVEVALYAASGDIGEFGDLFVGEALALEPQDLHLLLDPRMRMMVALVADGVEVFAVKVKRHMADSCTADVQLHSTNYCHD